MSSSQVGKWRSRTGMHHGQLIQTSISGLMEQKNPYWVRTCQGSANASQRYIWRASSAIWNKQWVFCLLIVVFLPSCSWLLFYHHLYIADDLMLEVTVKYDVLNIFINIDETHHPFSKNGDNGGPRVTVKT